MPKLRRNAKRSLRCTNTVIRRGAHMHVDQMRALLEQAEHSLQRGHLYAAYQCFDAMRGIAFGGANLLSRATPKAARHWGHM